MTLPKNTYAFNFLGDILTVYHNPKRKDTFGKNRCQVQEYQLTYVGSTKTRIVGQAITGKDVDDVRNGKVERIDVYFE